ncbi:ABC transporter substrate-binding protein [Limnochorda pilosa]|uniref:Sugar ABC transporter substrate-binding protein n=1 Tax=Limnochorda pilosa TaxID=1555112 RepID=A0A0K2SGL5_LIMPI|nr:sugar ABC transporter substrate-binding protein [Limnochorda pilosa]BAS26253.1 hypothetical protein LIP_0396 [Limnochorda pilosa]
MRLSRAITSLTLAVTVLMGVALAPGSVEAAKVTVNVAVTVGPNANAARAIEPIFEERYPDIDVNVVEIPWTDIYHMQILDFMARRGNYDLVMQSTSFFGEYVLSGFLEPLGPYFQREDLIDRDAFNLDDFNPEVLAGVGSYDGELYALPYMYFPQVMVYREDLMERIGMDVPTTFQEYRQVVEALDALPGMHGTSVIGIKGGAGGNVYAWGPYLFSFGGYYVDTEGRPTFNSPEAVAALEYYVDLYKYSPSEAINMGTDQVTSAFGAGDIGIMLMDGDNAGALLDPGYTDLHDQVRFAPVPAGPSGEGIPLLGAWSWGISKYSRHKDEAFKVLTFFLGNDPEVTSTFVKHGIHPRLSVLRTFGEEYPNYGVVAEELAHVRTVPVIPNWQQIEDALGNAISKAILGQLSPREALDQAQRVAESLSR